MSAREAVAQALHSQDIKGLVGTSWIEMSDGSKVPWLRRADAALAALRPIIAAEIRAWAEREREVYDCAEMVGPGPAGRRAELDILSDSADHIAASITTTGDEQQ